MLGMKYRLLLLRGGGAYRFTMFFSHQHYITNAKMQRTWLHGFRSLNCRGWIKGALVVFAFATMLGSYLSTFLNSFLSKELHYNQLQTRMTVTNIRPIVLWK